MDFIKLQSSYARTIIGMEMDYDVYKILTSQNYNRVMRDPGSNKLF